MKKNILIIVHSKGVGGVERRFFNLYLFLKTNRVDDFNYTFLFSRLFLSSIQFSPSANPDESITKLIPYGLGGIFALWLKKYRILNAVEHTLLCFVLLKLIATKRFHLIHFVTTSSLKYRKLFKRRPKITSFYNGGSTLTGINNRAYKKAFKEDFYFDCLSSDIARILRDVAGVQDRRILTAPCSFVDMRNTGMYPEKKEKLVCFSGRLNRQKGVDLLLPVLNRFFHELPDYKLVIMGNGPMQEELRKTINELNLSSRIELFFDPSPKEYLIRSVIFLSLQKNENYPSQSLLEAMACGNAIIATNVGLTRLLVDETNGVLINEDSDELINAMINLSKNPASFNEMGIQSYEKVKKSYTVDKFHSYLSDAYTMIINEQL